MITLINKNQIIVASSGSNSESPIIPEQTVEIDASSFSDAEKNVGIKIYSKFILNNGVDSEYTINANQICWGANSKITYEWLTKLFSEYNIKNTQDLINKLSKGIQTEYNKNAELSQIVDSNRTEVIDLTTRNSELNNKLGQDISKVQTNVDIVSKTASDNYSQVYKLATNLNTKIGEKLEEDTNNYNIYKRLYDLENSTQYNYKYYCAIGNPDRYIDDNLPTLNKTVKKDGVYIVEDIAYNSLDDAIYALYKYLYDKRTSYISSDYTKITIFKQLYGIKIYIVSQLLTKEQIIDIKPIPTRTPPKPIVDPSATPSPSDPITPTPSASGPVTPTPTNPKPSKWVIMYTDSDLLTNTEYQYINIPIDDVKTQAINKSNELLKNKSALKYVSWSIMYGYTTQYGIEVDYANRVTFGTVLQTVICTPTATNTNTSMPKTSGAPEITATPTK